MTASQQGPDRGKDDPTKGSVPKGDPIWGDDLGDYRARFERLLDEPDQLIAELREDRGFHLAVVRADTMPVVRTWFAERDAGFRVNLEHSGPVGPASVGTAWVYEGHHVEDRAFNGMRATGKQIELRGYTIMSAAPGADGGRSKLQSRRYVDWAGLYGQLGLSIDWRVPVPAPKSKRPRLRKRAD
jgi:hypothetical protein